MLSTLLRTCALLAGLTSGLALRHDVEEAQFVELGQSFPAVVQIGGLASGTLVAQDWVLTAAHVPEMLQRMLRGAPLTVSIGGEEYEVARVVVPEQRAAEPELHDLALLQLATPVPETIAPLPLWVEDVEVGSTFVLAGWGILAIGDEGVEMSPTVMTSPTRRLRAGWNTIERVDAESARFVARFDGPDTALALEAGPCVGDSGGPALVRVEGKDDAPATWHVAGVIALVDDTDNDGILGEYGDEFGMTAVAKYADWIRTAMAE
jgi:hypothetical protein